MKVLVIGAGVTGCYTAARLLEKGVETALCARGERADRLEANGLTMRDGITGQERNLWLRILRSPVAENFTFVMVTVGETQRQGVRPLIEKLWGRPYLWFLGNTASGFDWAGDLWGRERVLGGFPGVGGTWDGDVLVYVDKKKQKHKPFDRLVIGEAFAEAAPAALFIQERLNRMNMTVERHVPIMAWHWSHLATVLPLAGAIYCHDGDPEAVADDTALIGRTVQAMDQCFDIVRSCGYPILPRRLCLLRWLPAVFTIRKLASLLRTPFSQIGLAAHAMTAREELHNLAHSFLSLAGESLGTEGREMLQLI